VRRPILAGGLVAAISLISPVIAQACTVSLPLSAEELAARAMDEGAAWREAPLVYLARVTGTDQYETWRLEPVRVLKGGRAPAVLDAPSQPSPGMCRIYHGLNVMDGAWIGDEFVVYLWDEAPTTDSRMLIVSTRMLGDPATRRALEDK